MDIDFEEQMSLTDAIKTLKSAAEDFAESITIFMDNVPEEKQDEAWDRYYAIKKALKVLS